jgi:hypothetical protein
MPATTWRYSLEDPHTGEKSGFADLGSLFAFLASLASDAGNTKRE